MPTFGDYETIGEPISVTEDRGTVTAVWKARRTDSKEDRLYAIKSYQPRRRPPSQAQPEQAPRGDRALDFLQGIEDLKKAGELGRRCVAPVHAHGLTPEGAFYVTDYCEDRTLKEFITRHGEVNDAMLRHIVYSVATGCLALKGARSLKYSHGNLKPSNVLLAGKRVPLRRRPLQLIDPQPSPLQLTALDEGDLRDVGELLADVIEAHDLRAIGELIFQLVEKRLITKPEDYGLYPVERSDRWDSLGKHAEFWVGLCNRLLDPKLSLEAENLRKLEKEFRPRLVKDNLGIVVGAVGGICLVSAGVYTFWPKEPAPGSLPLTITIESITREYGHSNPVPKVTLEGARPRDKLTARGSTAANAGSPVGTYEITALLDDPKGRRRLYTVATNNGTLTVTPGYLQVSAGNAQREYRQSNPELTPVVEGVLLKEDGIKITNRTGANVDSPTGNYNIEPVIIDPLGKLTNYRVTTNFGRLTVSPVQLTVTADNTNRYEGEPNPSFTVSIKGIKSGDEIRVSFQTAATTSSPAREYDIVPALNDRDKWQKNYRVILNKGTLTVLKRPAVQKPLLTITATNQSRPYGTANPALSGLISGLRTGDRFDVRFATKAGEGDAVGSYEIFPILSDPNNKLTNYTVITNKGTLTVTAVALTVVVTNQSRGYGTTNPPLRGWVTPNRDGIIATYGTVADVGSPVGEYDIVPALIDAKRKLSNYTVSTNKGILTITPANLTITASNLSRPYGVTNSPLTGWVSSNRDDITATYWTKADASSAPGPYDIVPMLVDNSHKLRNYTVTTNHGTLTVLAKRTAPLAVAAHDETRSYGMPNLLLTGTIGGLRAGDSIDVKYTTKADAGSAVGTYDILPVVSDPGKLKNYSLTIRTGALTITRAPLTVTAHDQSRPYGSENPSLTGAIEGLRNGDSITATYATTADSRSPPGTYEIVPLAFTDLGHKLANYAVITNKGRLTISGAASLVSPVKATTEAQGQHPGITSLFGVANLDFVWIPGIGRYVAVAELSASQFSNLCSKCQWRPQAAPTSFFLDSKFENGDYPAQFGSFQDATGFVAALNRFSQQQSVKRSFQLLNAENYVSLVESPYGKTSLSEDDVTRLRGQDNEYVGRTDINHPAPPRKITQIKPAAKQLLDVLGNLVEWTSEGKLFGIPYWAPKASSLVNSKEEAANAFFGFSSGTDIGVRLAYEP